MDAEQARRVGGGLLPLLDERHNFLLLVGLELRRPAADPAFLARGVEARLGPFLEHRALELGERADHQVHFEAAPAGAAVVAALEYLKRREAPARAQDVAPYAVVTTAWRRYVYGANDAVDHRAYTFCVLDQLREALRRRDVFVTPSWRYADPRRNLLAGAEWEAARPIMCRTLSYSPRPEPILAALSDELDQTYRAVAARLPNNPAVRFERIDGKDDPPCGPSAGRGLGVWQPPPRGAARSRPARERVRREARCAPAPAARRCSRNRVSRSPAAASKAPRRRYSPMRC